MQCFFLNKPRSSEKDWSPRNTRIDAKDKGRRFRVGSAPVSGVGFGVSPKRTFLPVDGRRQYGLVEPGTGREGGSGSRPPRTALGRTPKRTSRTPCELPTKCPAASRNPRSAAWYTQMLLDRNALGDRERACTLLTEAVPLRADRDAGAHGDGRRAAEGRLVSGHSLCRNWRLYIYGSRTD